MGDNFFMQSFIQVSKQNLTTLLRRNLFSSVVMSSVYMPVLAQLIKIKLPLLLTPSPPFSLNAFCKCPVLYSCSYIFITLPSLSFPPSFTPSYNPLTLVYPLTLIICCPSPVCVCVCFVYLLRPSCASISCRSSRASISFVYLVRLFCSSCSSLLILPPE